MKKSTREMLARILIMMIIIQVTDSSVTVNYRGVG